MSDLSELIELYQAVSQDDPDEFLEMHVEATRVRQVKGHIPIAETHETLVPIPTSLARRHPHPYEALGAPYGKQGPWQVRVTVAERLERAQQSLARTHPGYRLEVFDAWRPVEVQAFMVTHECHRLAREQEDDWERLGPESKQAIKQQVLRYWAAPMIDPLAPPPHSTGGAVDVTILDENECPLTMGSDIDELGPQAHPHYFSGYEDSRSQQFHDHREQLLAVMTEAGFCRLPWEWWHFSYGDQMWALQESLKATPIRALYGAAV